MKRTSAGKHRGVICNKLRVEEFVFGFLAMLKDQKGKWDKEEMISFYETVGFDIEKGLI